MDDHHSTPCCERCGEPVGVYEPLWFERDDGAIEGSSILNLRSRGLEPRRLRVWHAACRPSEGRGRTGS